MEYLRRTFKIPMHKPLIMNRVIDLIKSNLIEWSISCRNEIEIDFWCQKSYQSVIETFMSFLMSSDKQPTVGNANNFLLLQFQILLREIFYWKSLSSFKLTTPRIDIRVVKST